MKRQMNDKLQKLLAHTGLGSRREIEKWIAGGRITVNGKRATVGDRVNVMDKIFVDGKPVYIEQRQSDRVIVLLYHKPEGQICSRNDPQDRPTVFANLPKLRGGRWVSVGRLDLNSSGLLLFTNSGELANALMHPSTEIEREYLVRIRGRASEGVITKLTKSGVFIDGKRASFKSVSVADGAEEGTNHWYRVVITEGRYREVRRMWDSVGHTVSRLKRIRYGSVKLTRNLKRGQSIKMAPKQLDKLIHTAHLSEQFAHALYDRERRIQSTSRVRAPSNRITEKKPRSPKRGEFSSGEREREVARSRSVRSKGSSTKQSKRKR